MSDKAASQFHIQLDKEEYQQVEQETIAAIHRGADQVIQYFIYGLFILGQLIAFADNTWLLSLGFGSFFLVSYILARRYLPGTSWHNLTIALALASFPIQYMAQLPQSSLPYLLFFVHPALLVLFQNWRLFMAYFIVLLGYVAIPLIVYFVLNQVENETVNSIVQLVIAPQTLIVFLLLLATECIVLSVFAQRIRDKRLSAETLRLQFQKQISNMQKNIGFAEAIAGGDLAVEYTSEEGDIIGHSLLEMRQSLNKASQEDRQRSWATQGIAATEEILRLYNKSLDELAYKVIAHLIKYLNANQGGIFILNDDDESQPFLELKGMIAFDRKKYLEKRIEVGQGMVGQVFREKVTTFMTDIPANYIHITSGLGDAPPGCLTLVPLKMEDQVIGVMEIASFSPFKPHEVTFLEKVAESIASTIISSKNNERTQNLLQESQELTEQMRAQEEEVRQNMEEMQATQEEMRRQQSEIEQKEANLNALINNTDDSIITIDRKYRVQVINQTLRARYAGTQFAGIKEGANALDMLGDVLDEWKEYYDRVLEGETLQFIKESSVKGEETTYRQYFLNPIKGTDGQIVGLSVFSRDVSDIKRTEIKNRQLIRDLQQKEKLFDSAFYNIQLSPEKHIQRVNDLSLKLLGYQREELIGRHINDLLANEHMLRQGLTVMEDEEVWHEEVELVDKGGQTHRVKCAATTILTTRNEPDCYILTFYK